MKSPNSETFQLSLEKTLSKFQPKNSVKIDKNLIVESFECDEDSEGNFNDTDAFIEFESGQIYRGAYIGNSIEGQGAFQDDLGAVWNGSFVDGCLDGWVQVSGLNTHFHEEFFRRGVSSGCYRYLTKHSDELELQVKRAKYVYKWRECPGGGFLVETRSPKGNLFLVEVDCAECSKSIKIEGLLLLIRLVQPNSPDN